MEEWLGQLEMDVDKTHTMFDESKEIISEGFDDDEIATVLGGTVAADHFSYNHPFSSESNASNYGSPGGADNNYDFLISSDPMPLGALLMGEEVIVQPPSSSDSVEGNDHDFKKVNNNKRKREPKQVEYHILAERKRRELLSAQFISLSSILPNLKKTDKTSVLGEAIKYLKQLQERVEVLEELSEKHKHTVNSLVVVKKSTLVVTDGGGGGGVDKESYSSCVNESEKSLPEIEVKICQKLMLIKLYCQNYNGLLPKVYQELEKLNLTVVNSSVIPFATLALDITILAQMDMEMNANVKDVIKSLRKTVSSM